MIFFKAKKSSSLINSVRTSSHNAVLGIIFLFGFLITLCIPHVSLAQFTDINEWNVQYTVHRDGVISVVQTIVIDGAHSEGSFELVIPKEYIKRQGRVDIMALQVLDRDHFPLDEDVYSIREFMDGTSILLTPYTQDQESVFYLTYEITRGFRTIETETGDAHDLFIWDVVSETTDTFIEQIAVVVLLPDVVNQQSIEQKVTITKQEVEVESIQYSRLGPLLQYEEQNLGPEESMTISAQWESGAIDAPPIATVSKVWRVMKYPYYALPIVAFMFLSVWFLKYGRDPKGKGRRPVQQTPPGHLPPAHLGSLIEEHVRIKFLIALLLDLAQRGYIRIIEVERKSTFSRKDYTFTSRHDFDVDQTLSEVERYFLQSLFGSPYVDEQRLAMVKLSDLKNRFAARISTLRAMIMDDLVTQKYFRGKPQSARVRYFGWAIVFAAVGMVIWLIAGILYHNIFSVLPFFLISALFVSFAPLMPQKTKKGVEAAEAAKGFVQFLCDPEQVPSFTQTEKLFSKYLPYAVVFGVEKDWFSAFQDQLTQSPDWYVSSSDFRLFSPTEFYHIVRTHFVHAASQTLRDNTVDSFELEQSKTSLS